jgi:L-cysteine/cystine lyase
VAQFEAAITPRTRLLAFSHVAWNIGIRLPLEKIVAMGHRHHVLSLVDGAQSVGAIPLDFQAGQVDFYAMPGQKWLCGPEGTGALYVRQTRLSQVAPTFVGFSTLEDIKMYDFLGYFMPARTGRRYEVGSVYRPGIKAMATNLAWLKDSVGWDWIYGRIAHLAGYAYATLSNLSGVTMITPPEPQSGLITFCLDGYAPPRVMTELAANDIVLRFLRHPYALRIATGFYNTEEEIDRLAAALKAILDRSPESLPQFAPPTPD